MGIFQKLFRKKRTEPKDSPGKGGKETQGSFVFEANGQPESARGSPTSSVSPSLIARRIQSAQQVARDDSGEKSPPSDYRSETRSSRGRIRDDAIRRDYSDEYVDDDRRSSRSSVRYVRTDSVGTDLSMTRSQGNGDSIRPGNDRYYDDGPRYDETRSYSSPRVRHEDRYDDREYEGPRPRDDRYDSPRSVRHEYAESPRRRRAESESSHRHKHKDGCGCDCHGGAATLRRAPTESGRDSDRRHRAGSDPRELDARPSRRVSSSENNLRREAMIRQRDREYDGRRTGSVRRSDEDRYRADDRHRRDESYDSPRRIRSESESSTRRRYSSGEYTYSPRDDRR